MFNRLLELTGQATRSPQTGLLTMTNPRGDTFQITIQLLSGREFDLWVYEDTTIERLAKDIAILENMPVEKIRFGNELHWMDSHTGEMLSRLWWLWEPNVAGGWKGDWTLTMANLKNSSKVYVDWLAEEEEEVEEDFMWLSVK